MASALTRNTTSASSRCSSACISRRNIRERASVWRSAAAWWSGTAAPSGSPPLQVQAAPSALQYPTSTRKAFRMLHPLSHRRLAEFLLVDDNEDDVFLTREAFESSRLRVNLHH